MENNNKPHQQELKIELTPEIAAGHYSNLAVISHSPNEFFMDFIAVSPNMPQARVQTRVIMTPENAKQLMFALTDNVKKYEANFGEIQQRHPKGNMPPMGKKTTNNLKPKNLIT